MPHGYQITVVGIASYHRKKVIAVRAPEKANGAARKPFRELGRQIGEDVAAYLFNGSKQASAAAQINEALEENLRPLRKDVAEFNGRLEQLQNDLDDFKKAESSKEDKSAKGGWRGLFQKTSDDPDRARERTRAHIAYFLIVALVVAIAATYSLRRAVV